MQLENETVNTFTPILRGMVHKCNFGNFLNRALRDQSVSGICNRDTQRKLLEEDRGFQDCVIIPVADETARVLSANLQTTSNSLVHFLSHSKSTTALKSIHCQTVFHIHTDAICVVNQTTRETSVNNEMLNVTNARKKGISLKCIKTKNQLPQGEEEDVDASELTMYTVSDSVSNITGDVIYVPLQIEGKLSNW